MNLVGKRVRIKGWGPHRGRIGKCVEYVEGHYDDNSQQTGKPIWIDGYYVVEIGEGAYKFERGEVAEPWFGAGLLHALRRRT